MTSSANKLASNFFKVSAGALITSLGFFAYEASAFHQELKEGISAKPTADVIVNAGNSQVLQSHPLLSLEK